MVKDLLSHIIWEKGFYSFDVTPLDRDSLGSFECLPRLYLVEICSVLERYTKPKLGDGLRVPTWQMPTLTKQVEFFVPSRVLLSQVAAIGLS